jgi:hypothetical protein
MSKPIVEIEDGLDDELGYGIDIEDGDYGFVIGPDGKLKSVFLPETFELDPPREIQKILKIFGIKDVYQIDAEGHTLH